MIDAIFPGVDVPANVPLGQPMQCSNSKKPTGYISDATDLIIRKTTKYDLFERISRYKPVFAKKNMAA